MNKKAYSKALKTLEELQQIPKESLFIVEYTDGKTEKVNDTVIILNTIRQLAHRQTNTDHPAVKKITYKPDRQNNKTIEQVRATLAAAGEPDPEIGEV